MERIARLVKRTSALVLWTCIVCTLAPRAAAQDEQDEEARGLFSAGSAAFSNGRYDEAREYFERAYDLSHRAELLYNIGQAADRARHDAIALEAFERYLAQVTDVPNRTEIEGRIRVLRAALAAQTAAPAPPSEPPPTPATAPPPQVEPPVVVGPSPPLTEHPPPSASVDVGAVVLTASGGVVAIAGAIMLAVGVPELYPPRAGFIFATEQTRQQSAQILTGVGAVALGLGIVGVVVGVVMLMMPSARSGSTAIRATPDGLALSF